MKLCNIEGCTKKHLARGFCKNHYYEFYLKENKEVNYIKQIEYKNSLEYYAIENNMEYLVKEFSNKNEMQPKDISKGSDKIVWWNCLICSSEYDMSITRRTRSRKTNCPYCAGMRANHTNCLWTTHPEIAKLLNDQNIGYQITAGSNKKVDFRCYECENLIPHKKIVDVVKRGFSCPKCSDGISYPEKFMLNVLEQSNVEFETQKSFNWSLNKRYDFYVPTLNLIIETHGGQHYGKFKTFHGLNLKDIQENDRLKEQLARKNGIENYIAVDCSISELDFIKNSLINSKFKKLIDLKNVNWLKCHEHSCKTLVKTVCEMWNDGVKTTRQIAKNLNLDLSTVNDYLKQGNILDWCIYDPEESFKNAVKNNKFRAVPVVQLTKDGKFIKEWESGTEAERETGVNMSHIVSVCKGEYGRKSAGGFIWVYKDNYDANKNYTYVKLKKYVPVIQFSLENEFIKEWESATKAGNSLGILRSNIHSACKGRYKYSGGFKWLFKDDYEKISNQI